MIDRRQLLERAAMLLGAAVSSSAAAGILAGCVSTPGASGGEKFLTAEEMRTVTAMSEQIIPRTDTPGAIDAGVPAFIDRMMAGFYQDRERKLLRAGLAQVATDANELRGVAFADLAPADQVMLMKEYDRLAFNQARSGGEPHFFRTMKELTTLGFFTSETGADHFLKYDPVPGPYRADVPYSQIGRAWAT